MPVLMNFGMNAILGWATARIASNSEEFRQEKLGWIPLFLVVFETVIYTPAAIYLFRFYPHWSTHYLFDPHIYVRFYYWSFWISVLIILGNFTCILGSYFLTRWFHLREQGWLQHFPFVCGVAALFAGSVVYWTRLIRVTTFHAYWKGEGEFFFTHPVGLIGFGLLGLSVVYLLVVKKLFFK